MTGTLLLAGGESNASNGGKLNYSKDAAAKSSNILQGPKQIVDGSINPDNIRPEVAYSIFFRMLTGGKNDLAQSHSSALAKSLALNDKDISSLFSVAEEFRQRVSSFDNAARNIKDKYHPDHSRIPTVEDKAVLADLEKKKDSLVLKLVSILPRRLSPDGWYKVHHYVKDTIRRKTKIVVDDNK
jgi:hypothetical protein